MKINILKSLAVALPIAAFSAIPTAFADTITGKINGHGCAHSGVTCPVDRLDPHLAIEPDFVLQRSDGDYLFLTNLPRDTKVRYVLSDVKVTGDLSSKYQSMTVNELMVKKGGQWEKVWSKKNSLEALLESNDSERGLN